MEEIKRGFKGVWIPREIWLNKELSLQEKVFIIEIDSLDNKDGCYASNNHFKKFFNLSLSRCSEVINKLVKGGYITAKYETEGKQIIKRILRISKRGILFPVEGYSEKAIDSNTKKSNTKKSNTKINKNIYTNSGNEEKKTNLVEQIEAIYTHYPSSCPITKRSTGKCSRDKERISRLLHKHSAAQLINICDSYLSNCKATKTFVKNFSTFLNNLPELEHTKPPEKMKQAERMFSEVIDRAYGK